MLDAAAISSLRYRVRRTSHGTINTGTNPGKSAHGLRKKHHAPPPIDDDAATQIDSHKIRSSLDDDFEVPDFSGGKPLPQHDPDAATAVRGGTPAKKAAPQVERKQSGD